MSVLASFMADDIALSVSILSEPDVPVGTTSILCEGGLAGKFVRRGAGQNT